METSKLRRILEQLSHEIGGDWLLVGGALVQLELNAERATEDIDFALISSTEKTQEKLLTELFRFSMTELHLGPESLNTAVSPFLEELPGWRDECKLLMSGPAGSIYRPSLSLFLALKIRRSSTIDIEDMKAALKGWPKSELDLPKLQGWLRTEQFTKLQKILATQA
jgi:hypothetical protein